MKKIRPIAIHLPQFHPIPENDAWWGKGFTEWRNVVQAKPRFKGHYQPHIPADLGFYDLRLPEVRKQQADLAKQYGIYGFCYYHYWFNGRQVLERPVKEILESGEPDFPFMLCWANENWTKIWDGGEKNVLLKQNYSDEDHYPHAEFLMQFFKDPRYIKVDGKPVFIIYKDALIPDVVRLLEILREVAKKHDLELYLCRFERGIGTKNLSAVDVGFDAGIEFQPLSLSFSKYRKLLFWKPTNILRNVAKLIAIQFTKLGIFKSWLFSHGLLDNNFNYDDFLKFDIKQAQDDHLVFPGVSPGFDNSARRVSAPATVFKGSTPELFKKWVELKVKLFSPPTPEENFLFINAWNEWAEGNHLEPCVKYGHAYLEAFKQGLEAADVTSSSGQETM